jgi:polycystin 1L2
MLDFCTAELSFSNQDKSSYGFGWSQYNQNYTPPNGYQSIYNAFQYKDADSLQGSPIQGQYATYDGSGYLYELRGKLDYIQGNLSLLKEMQWIDRQTRAVFIEFSVFNPNIDLVMVSTILVEFLSSGSILTTARFDPLNLFAESGQSILSFKILCELIFIGFIIYFTINEIRNILKKDLKTYLNEFWNYLEWAIIITAFVSLGMFLVRLKIAQQVLDFFKTTGGYGYLKLQKVNDCNQTLTFCLGLCSSLGTLKILKMLQFNRNISLVSSTLRRCFGELMSFTLVFFMIWISFVQLLFSVFGNHLLSYSSFVKSMESAFLIMLGKANAYDFLRVYPVLGPLIYSSYNVVILCFALNLFLSIITDSFGELRREAKTKPNDFDLINHLILKMKGLSSKNSKQEKLISPDEYKDHINVFPDRIQRLTEFIHNVSI